jgi:DNA-binding transcriptional LysR family regulator
VGRAIARLEARLGVRLLERTTRSMHLTDEGRRFYERALPLLDGLEEAALDASGTATVVRGRLRVNVDPSSRRWRCPAASRALSRPIRSFPPS